MHILSFISLLFACVFRHSCVLAQQLQSCLTFCDPMDPRQATRLLCPWNSPGKNTGGGCHAVLQGIFSTLGLNPRQDLRSPALAGGFFTTSATRETEGMRGLFNQRKKRDEQKNITSTSSFPDARNVKQLGGGVARFKFRKTPFHIDLSKTEMCDSQV